MKTFLIVLLSLSSLAAVVKIIALACLTEMPERTPGNVAFGAIEDMVWAGFALYFVLTMS